MSEQTCPVCEGKRMVYFMQGGPHGIGRWGRCSTCKGTGIIEGGGDERLSADRVSPTVHVLR
jgi:hypothetical protein